MIGKLTGRLDEVSLNTVIVDVNGVGYEVTVGARTTTSLPPVGETVTLAIDTHVREDEIRLYGFASEHERAWFRALQTVQGVGARIALAVLGTFSAADLANAVALQDKAAVSQAPGVGPKVAARIVSELKDKMPSLAPAIRPRGGFAPVAALPEGLAARDAVSALTNLGYAHGEAAAAISAAVGKIGRDARPEELIRLGLKELAHG
jgi:Holliday junction DNA helicase RuvA